MSIIWSYLAFCFTGRSKNCQKRAWADFRVLWGNSLPLIPSLLCQRTLPEGIIYTASNMRMVTLRTRSKHPFLTHRSTTMIVGGSPVVFHTLGHLRLHELEGCCSCAFLRGFLRERIHPTVTAARQWNIRAIFSQRFQLTATKINTLFLQLLESLLN